jgi:two-component system, NtrC family, sensor kinase
MTAVDTVLIVDDSLTVRMDLAEALQAASLQTVVCATAAEARAALHREPVALAILDVILPDGDGVDLLAEIRADAVLADLPILMLSSEAEVKDRVRGLRSGADDYVGKPYDTRFVVARACELVRRRSTARGSAAAPERPSVLVIDDSPTFREALGSALDAAGYSVVTASDGARGLEAAASRRPSAIVVDGVMPDLDGATVIRRIRLDPALRTTPCVLLTGSSDRGDELRALDAGADAFVRKEEELELILARLSAVLRVSAAARENTASLLAPKRILAVDDSPTYLEALAELLRNEGYDVVLAHSGEEALEMLAIQSVDCILLDLQMPGLGGTETCRRVKSSPLGRDLPLIMLTAREDRGSMLDGLSAGADDYIPKSAAFEVLEARVRAQIRRKQFEDEHRRVREELLRSEMEAAESRASRALAETKSALAEELARKNKELEAFSYSISHDLRAPLRSIDGFSQALLEDYGDVVDARGQDYLRRVRAAAQRMAELIEDLLGLSRLGRTELVRSRVDLAAIGRAVFEEVRRKDPQRAGSFTAADNLIADADPRLVQVVLENLIGNAWKFTARTAAAQITLGSVRRDGALAYYVRDNGAGFDMHYAGKLFTPFQRLHSDADFPGTGIGLATVHRIVDRHGGRVWAEGEVGLGATIYFTLPSAG